MIEQHETARRLRRSATVGLIVGALLAVTACSGAKSSKPVGPRVSVPTAASITVADSTYTWKPVRLGAGGYVTGLVIHPTAPNVRFLRTDVGGAYRWDPSISEWVQMLRVDAVPDAASHRGDYAVESVAVSASDPNVVYLSVGNDFNPAGADLSRTGRVLRSSDGGRTWTTGGQQFFISGNQEYRQLSERLAIDPVDPQHIVLGTRREGVWTSSDGGATFAQAVDIPTGSIRTPDQDQAGAMFATFDPQVPGRIYVGVAGAGIYRSDDNGVSWRQIRAIAAGESVPAGGAVGASRLYVSFNDAGTGTSATIEVYDPTADVWGAITPDVSAPQLAVAVDPSDPQHLIAAPSQSGKSKLLRSLDGGQSWKPIDLVDATVEVPWIATQSNGAFAYVGQIAIDPLTPNRLWWADGIGVFRGDDATVDPIKMVLDSRGVEELVTSEIIIPPGSGPTVAVADFQGFHLDDLSLYPQSMLLDDHFIGGTDLDYSGQQPKSLVWIGAEYQLYFSDAWKPRAAVSNDGGVTWKPLPGLNKDMFGGEVAMSASDPQNIVWLPTYFGDLNGYRDNPKGIYVTANGGKDWKQVPDLGGTNDFHRQLWWLGRQALAADKVAAATFYVLSNDGRFFVSSDGGATWTERPGAPPCTDANDCHVVGQLRADPANAGFLWASLGRGGLYRTTDAGTSWQQLPGVEQASAVAVGAAISPSTSATVYISGRLTDQPEPGIWRTTDDGATWERIAAAPAGLYLEPTALGADPAVPGRLFVGFGGTGVIVGTDSALSVDTASG